MYTLLNCQKFKLYIIHFTFYNPFTLYTLENDQVIISNLTQTLFSIYTIHYIYMEQTFIMRWIFLSISKVWRQSNKVCVTIIYTKRCPYY